MLFSTRIPGIKTATRVGQWIHSRFTAHALVLGYHQVNDESSDLYGVRVSPNHFQQQMEVLHHFAEVVRLQELIEGIKRGLPNRSIAITFDDGYSDLLYIVKPILEDYRLPFTAFISTGYIGQEFWWDELKRLVTPGNSTTYHSVKRLYQQLLSLPLDERRRTIEHLREDTVHETIQYSGSRALKLDELVELSRGNLVEIGSHGVNHISLGQISADEQRHEIQESKAFLEDQLGRCVNSFSYPNGSVSVSTKELISTSGYDYACGSKPGLVFHSSDLYHLPRFWVPDWDGRTFKRWLSRWI